LLLSLLYGILDNSKFKLLHQRRKSVSEVMTW